MRHGLRRPRPRPRPRRKARRGLAGRQAGLEPGDVIQTIDGKPVNTAQDFVSTIGAMKPGTKITLRVWSQGVKKNVSATLAEQPVQQYLQNQQQQNP